MHRYTNNPPSRQIAPRPVLKPSIRHNPLLGKVEAYLTRSGMSDAGFGQLAASDPSLLRDLRAGAQPEAPVIAKVDQFLARATGGLVVRHA